MTGSLEVSLPRSKGTKQFFCLLTIAPFNAFFQFSNTGKFVRGQGSQACCASCDDVAVPIQPSHSTCVIIWWHITASVLCNEVMFVPVISLQFTHYFETFNQTENPSANSESTFDNLWIYIDQSKCLKVAFWVHNWGSGLGIGPPDQNLDQHPATQVPPALFEKVMPSEWSHWNLVNLGSSGHFSHDRPVWYPKDFELTGYSDCP